MFQTPLPTELALLILSYLPLSSIRSLILSNNRWANFIEQNKSTIYRNAAFVEGYVDPRDRAVSVDELIANPEGRREKKSTYSPNAMRGVHGWRKFCKRRKLIERSWAGRDQSQIVPSPRSSPSASGSGCDNVDVPEPAHYRRVHRIKADENAGITIATTQLGGLVVRDIGSDAVLWELPMWYVRQYAHLEYGQGYMVFDRDDGNKEVWRRTAEIDSGTAASEAVEAISAPDDRQKHVVNYINHLTSNSPSFPPGASASSSSSPSSSASAHHNPNFKARFTPHAILHMPEITRAYRYVFPTLLVASLERAYLWDVRTGALKQIISGIQVIRTPEDEEGTAGSEDDDHSEDERDQPAQDQLMAEDIDLLDVLPPINFHDSAGQSHSDDDDFSSSDDEDEAVQLPRFLGLVRYIDLSARHVFFAGRYLLRIFSRETGRCVMDIPSTRWRYGKWRWEIASRESMSRGGESAAPEGVDLDSYEKARREGREVVRMPVRFSLEEYPRAGGRVVIDQFIAECSMGMCLVHVSNDGKHLVGLLSGSRLVIIHNFESFLGPGPAVEPPPPSSKGKETSASTSRRHQQPTTLTTDTDVSGPPLSPISNPDPVFSMPGSYPSTSTSTPFAGPSNSNGAPSHNHSHNDTRASARFRQARRQRRLKNREARQTRRRAKDAKDEEIFEHTIDVQLGAPAASSGIYLAYENGRIGVVTSNAIYIVIPPIPSPPSSSLTSSTTSTGPGAVRRNRTIDVPKLEVMRLPFFSNPSWLSEVSCLMMSDTGLFVNWNPLWPRMPGDEVELAERVWEDDEDADGRVWEGDGEGEGDGDASASAGVGVAAGEGDNEGLGSGTEDDGDSGAVEVEMEGLQPLRRRRDRESERHYENDRHEQMMRKWEREYEEDLVDYERFEGERYHLFPNGDMFVTPRPRDVVESDVSTIYRVDFVPSSDID
ncbi:hypothetical protein CVT25_003036 [Psilocybe cyanescens]|uniref:F-box domain-containing protein n=1 Tax=Psilocybe cyanescens TaxID=93625 RepID=A0A409XK88_PSICY|nr:hypothetical protein CVT25_003036 [Psilocybe cyanescens]